MKADDLLDQAREATGLDDFGDDELFGGDQWRGALDVLLGSLDGDGHLHEVGELVVSQDLSRYAANRLRLVEHHRTHPAIRETDVGAPLVIIGQARTGTTMLFDLLAQDPDHRVPQTWEVDAPIPPPRTETYGTDPRIAESDASLAMVDLVIPEFRSVHQMGAQLAQECVIITGSVFTSAVFPTQYRVPTYHRWLLHDAMDDGTVASAMVWHRRFLEVLQSEHPGHRWLIKTPWYAWMLPELLAQYPEARLVQTHRDAARVLASTTSLIGTLRQLVTEDIDLHQIAGEFSELMLEGLERTVDARLDGTAPDGQVADVLFRDLMADPVASARAIYDHFDWVLRPEVEERMRHFLATHEREPAGHPYTFAATGLDLDDVRRRTARYADHFDVPLEPC